jgi:hypothetical protein
MATESSIIPPRPTGKIQVLAVGSGPITNGSRDSRPFEIGILGQSMTGNDKGHFTVLERLDADVTIHGQVDQLGDIHFSTEMRLESH